MLGRPHRLVVRRSSPAAVGLRRITTHQSTQLPFGVRLSLDPLADYWRTIDNARLTSVAGSIGEYLNEYGELQGIIEDPRILDNHREFLETFMLPLIPPLLADSEPSAAVVPFEYRSFYSTSAFQRLFTQEAGMLSGRVNLDVRTFTYGKLLSAYIHVLRTVYKIDVPFDYPVIFSTQDPGTGLDRHFKVQTDLRFVRIHPVGNTPSVDDRTAGRLLSNFTDLSEWIETIPPSAFEFYGFSLLRAYDVTDEQVIGLLERDLIAEENLVGRQSLPDVEDHIRTLLEMPGLELGLSTIDGEDFYLLNEPSQPLTDTFFSHSARHDLSALRGSLFERTLETRTLQSCEDLGEIERSPIERELYQWGVRSIVAAPLYVHSDPVGILYLWAPRPGSFRALNVMKLLEVLPIFSAAVRRVRDEMRNRVQNVILGRYTAIHPTVEWRFRQAALHILQNQEKDRSVEVEPIIFENVYPLYAATDIRSSSTHRNEAVQRDLLEHLELAEDVLVAAKEIQPLSIFYHLLARIARFKTALEGGLSSSDEAATRDFLSTDLEPILVSLGELGSGMKDRVERYSRAADIEHGTLHQRSRAYEDSVSTINETIADYLDTEQEKIQKIVPHYFEKRQTDGVDFNVYVGGSLLAEDEFDSLSVNLLRLWHLMAMSGIAMRLEPVRDSLQIPLETTQLVIVQNAPINIRYRFDETRFDVDGPHHVRFEIMKQRVEKAYIKGTRQRLTQPGKIAIVYSQEREASEYAGYITYLQETGFLSPEVEELQLDDLQGMKGLHALRVTVLTDFEEAMPEIRPERLRDVVEALVV